MTVRPDLLPPGSATADALLAVWEARRDGVVIRQRIAARLDELHPQPTLSPRFRVLSLPEGTGVGAGRTARSV